MTTNYINNPDFFAALVKYREECLASPDDLPRVPEFIGKCFLQIATGLARRPNFAGYSWRNDMIGDGIETCLKYVKSFDPSKSANPFAYFTQCCWYSFIGRIQSEKKQSRIKREMVRYANLETFTLQDHDDGGEFNVHLEEFLSGIGDDVPEVKKEKVVAKPSPMEDFMV